MPLRIKTLTHWLFFIALPSATATTGPNNGCGSIADDLASCSKFMPSDTSQAKEGAVAALAQLINGQGNDTMWKSSTATAPAYIACVLVQDDQGTINGAFCASFNGTSTRLGSQIKADIAGIQSNGCFNCGWWQIDNQNDLFLVDQYAFGPENSTQPCRGICDPVNQYGALGASSDSSTIASATQGTSTSIIMPATFNYTSSSIAVASSFPSSTTNELSSVSTSTAARSATANSALSESTPTTTATGQSVSSGGVYSTDQNIALGVGIGLGLPGAVAAFFTIWSVWVRSQDVESATFQNAA